MFLFCPDDVDDLYMSKIISRAEGSIQLTRLRMLKALDKDRRRYDSKHQMVSYAPRDLPSFRPYYYTADSPAF